jgi:hypothetical protein
MTDLGLFDENWDLYESHVTLLNVLSPAKIPIIWTGDIEIGDLKAQWLRIFEKYRDRDK